MIRKMVVLFLAAVLALCMAACEGASQTKEENSVLESSSVSSAVSSETASSGVFQAAGGLYPLESGKPAADTETTTAEGEEVLGESSAQNNTYTESSAALETTPSAAPNDKEEESFVSALDAASYARQIIAVAANGVTAEVSMHEKDENGCWKEILSTEGFVGTAGVGQASENTTATPKGTYTLTQAFGVSPDPGSGLPYVQVDASYYWVDDPSSPYYNQFVSTKQVAKNWNSAEHLVDSPSAYAYAVAIDYNLDCVPGAGSAFFLHCSTGAPTAGCVSVSKNDMIFILQHLSENAYIVIGTKEDF